MFGCPAVQSQTPILVLGHTIVGGTVPEKNGGQSVFDSRVYPPFVLVDRHAKKQNSLSSVVRLYPPEST